MSLITFVLGSLLEYFDDLQHSALDGRSIIGRLVLDPWSMHVLYVGLQHS